MLIATALMSAALLAARMVLVPVGGRHVSVIALTILIAIGLASYGGLAQGLGVFDALGTLKKVVGRLSKERKAGGDVPSPPDPPS